MAENKWEPSKIPISKETKAFLEYMATLERRIYTSTLIYMSDVQKKKEKENE